jgi:hypothetical protein
MILFLVSIDTSSLPLGLRTAKPPTPVIEAITILVNVRDYVATYNQQPVRPRILEASPASHTKDGFPFGLPLDYTFI